MFKTNTNLKSKLLAVMLAATMLLGIIPPFTLPVFAATNVPYLDASGNTQTAVLTEDLLGGGAVTLNNTGASSGWYSVSGNVTYTGTITISGDVHIILIDNSNLTVNGSLINAGINVTGTNSLTIHS